MINKRLSDLSCNEDEFKKAKPLYKMLSRKVDIMRKLNMKQVKI